MKPLQAPAVRVILYPGDRMSRTAVHSLATAASALVAVRVGGPWWLWVASYLGAFVGSHVVAVPFMTAWHAAQRSFERRVREIVEEELVAFDMRTYARQLRRIMPDAPEDPPAG